MPLDAKGNEPPFPSVETIARHYDALDYFYRDIWGEHIHHGLWLTGDESPAQAADQMSRRALTRLELGPKARLVDIGCGYGGTARIAAEEWAANVTGFTISASQKAYADGIPVMRGSVAIRLQDWEQAALATASVDAVLSLESIEHMPDRGSFLREARRILRPGGRMVVCTWLAAEKMSSWSRRHLLEPIAREGRQAPLVTARELTEVFGLAGFANVQVEELSLQVQRTWSVVIRRLVVRLLTRRRYWRELGNASPSDRIFGLTACRIWMSYHTGCMQYSLFTGW